MRSGRDQAPAGRRHSAPPEGQAHEGVGDVGPTRPLAGPAHACGDVAVEVADQDEADVVGAGQDAAHLGRPDGALRGGRPERQGQRDQAAGAQRPGGLAERLVDVVGVAAVGVQPGDDVQRPRVDVEDRRPRPAPPSGPARPARSRWRAPTATSGERAPDSSTMTALCRPSSLTRTIAASAPSAAHAAIGSPARGRPSAAGPVAGLVGVGAVGEHVAGPDPVGQVGAGQGERGTPGGDRPAQRRQRPGPAATAGPRPVPVARVVGSVDLRAGGSGCLGARPGDASASSAPR